MDLPWHLHCLPVSSRGARTQTVRDWPVVRTVEGRVFSEPLYMWLALESCEKFVLQVQ